MALFKVPKKKKFGIDWKSLAALLLKAMDIHEGHWEVYLEFERAAMKANFQTASGVVFCPGVLSAVTAIGIIQVDPPPEGLAETRPMVVDAAVVNPRADQAPATPPETVLN